MCGIIAVLRRQSRRTPPSVDAIVATLAEAERACGQGFDTARLAATADAVAGLDRLLKGVPGLWTLLRLPELSDDIAARAGKLQALVAAFERSLDADATTDPDPALEARNQALVRVKDALWSVLRDRLPHAAAVRDLAGGNVPHAAAAAALSSVQLA